jgi:hypothetical protein
MTNLFLNNNRYFATDNQQHINSGLGKVNNTEILRKVKPIFFQHLEQLLDDCCMRIDIEFGLQLGKGREKMGKDQYIKLLEYLRSVREDIERNYLFKVNDIFDASHLKIVNIQNKNLDFSKVSLISDDAAKENYAIAAIIRQCEHLFYEELTSLNKLFAMQPGKQTIADSQNPIFPEKLVRALVDVIKPLNLNADERITLYKTFETNVFSQLKFIYREVIKMCEAATTEPMPLPSVEQYTERQGGSPSPAQLYVVGEIKERVELPPVSAEQPSAEFEQLQKKLELWRLAQSPSDYDVISTSGNIFYEHFEIKNALQVLQQFSDDSDQDEKKLPLKWRVFNKLEELSFSVDAKILAKDDEDVLDLVALIFNEIERDELIQDSVKATVLKLEIPLAAASLGHYSIFTNRYSPARQLLDDLFATGMFLNADEHDDRLTQQRIANTVKKMTQDNGFELSGWIAEADEFSSYLKKHKLRTRNIEENLKQSMRDQQALVSNKKIIAITIENSIKGKTLPTEIVKFLRDVWSDVLLAAYMCKVEYPEQWKKSVQAMDDLIVSVIPPANDNERKQILKFLPGLIAELRKGLKQISYDKSAQSRFFKDLAVWHIILMDKKEAKKTAGDNSANSATVVETDKIQAEAIIDDSTEQAKNIAVENWVAFTSESGKQWGKLLWKDAEDMLFVGKNGVKILEIQEHELAEKLRLGRAVIIKNDEITITERALSELTGL